MSKFIGEIYIAFSITSLYWH